jgi:hypothetical protein
MLLYTSVLFFAVGLVDWLWHLNSDIVIYLTILCGLVVVFGIATTLLPMFTTRTPFKNPMSYLLGNLLRSVWRGEPRITDLMEEEEMDIVDAQGENLDKGAFRWLMKHMRDEQIYLDRERVATCVTPSSQMIHWHSEECSNVLCPHSLIRCRRLVVLREETRGADLWTSNGNHLPVGRKMTYIVNEMINP